MAKSKRKTTGDNTDNALRKHLIYLLRGRGAHLSADAAFRYFGVAALTSAPTQPSATCPIRHGESDRRAPSIHSGSSSNTCASPSVTSWISAATRTTST
jgi:hypothetical protein